MRGTELAAIRQRQGNEGFRLWALLHTRRLYADGRQRQVRFQRPSPARQKAGRLAASVNTKLLPRELTALKAEAKSLIMLGIARGWIKQAVSPLASDAAGSSAVSPGLSTAAIESERPVSNSGAKF